MTTSRVLLEESAEPAVAVTRDLTDYVTAVKRVLNVQLDEGLTFTDDLCEEGVRQALREYNQNAAPVAVEITVATAGHDQDISAITDFVELVGVAWPWDDDAQIAQRAVRWRWIEPGVIWIEDGEPVAGDLLLVYYRRAYQVADLDGAVLTTVPAGDDAMFALGAAAWTCELHYRELLEELGGPNQGQIKGMYSWAYLRLREWRAWLTEGQRAAAVVRPAWGGIGL